MGTNNPRSSIPLNSSTTHSANGYAVPMPNMPPLVPQSPFMNFPNQLLPFQSNHAGMPHFGSTVAPVFQGQCPVGYDPRNSMQSFNSNAAFQLNRPFYNLASNANQANQSQPPGQFFMHSPNVPQHFNQNMGVPYGQFYMQNPVQHMNQVNPMQMPNPVQNMNQVNPMQMPNPVQNMNQVNPMQMPNPVQNMNQVNPMQMPNPVQNMNQVNPMQMPNPVQNMNQVNPMQMPNPLQNGPYFVPNQVNQAMGPFNHAFITNLQSGLVHSGEGQHVNQNLQKSVHPSGDVNASLQLPIATQQSQGNLSTSFTQHSGQSRQPTNNLQHARSQGNHVEGGKNNISKSNGNKSNVKNFTGNRKNQMSHCGFQKSQSHHMKNAKRKFGGLGENGGKGVSSDRSGLGHTNSTNQARAQEKRSISLNYTEQEVQQWREERKKNYPSKANVDKKLTGQLTEAEVIDREAKLRRKQLKEILAKQAELGVEVAELPPQYLSDSENQLQGRRDNGRGPAKNGRFQNKYNKRGRNDKRDRFSKNRKLANGDSSNMSPLNTRSPTLLQKLLSADIRKDKNHLLQVFRLMAMNSSFKDSHEKPMEFPLVLVKDSGYESRIAEEKSSLMGKSLSKANVKTFVGEFDNEEEDDCDFDDDAKDAQVQEKASFGCGERIINEKNSLEGVEEEEGEILD